ncbi:MAG: isopentenyl phosphate kinase [archaeon]
MRKKESWKNSEQTMQNLYIIKLGGSVITEKEGNRFEAKEKALARIASEIKQAMEEKKFSLIAVHGAGPFGHTNVMEYGINNGVHTEKQKEGYEKTVKDCNFLNSRVVAALGKARIDAVAFDPNKIVIQDNKKIAEFETRQVGNALALGKVPVLFGQMVPDKSLNASVVSGDTIIAFLAKEFKPKKIFLGTDVAGIFTADPKKDSKAKRIPLIDKSNFEKIIEKVKGSSAIDVTGGMKGKLEKLGKMLQGTTAVIFDAGKEGNVYKALTGKKVEGTEVRL